MHVVCGVGEDICVNKHACVVEHASVYVRSHVCVLSVVVDNMWIMAACVYCLLL